MSPLGAVIVGLGNMGFGYDLEAPRGAVLAHTKACLGHAGVRLLAGVDPAAERRARFTEFATVPAFADLADCTALRGKTDLVIVATPTPSHEVVVQRALELLQPRAVFLEKPIASTPEEAGRIVELCTAHRARLAVNYFRRFDPFIEGLRGDLASGRWGQPRGGVCQYSGPLVESGSHFVDLLLNLFGPPSRVQRFSPAGDRPAFVLHWPTHDVVVRPVAGTAYSIGEIDLMLERGRVQLVSGGLGHALSEVGPHPMFPRYGQLRVVEQALQRDSGQRYQAVALEHVVDALTRERPFASDGASALATLSVCHGACSQ